MSGQQPTPSSFYVAGGTLRPDSPSYIERPADEELFKRALAGDFCYVLTTRQMGKSSLMARTARRLQEEGVATAIVDLTQIGTEQSLLSPDQWYHGISHRILRGLGIRFDLRTWWNERRNFSPLQRLSEFLGDVLLEGTSGRIVVFVDEIDSTLGLAFSDDFFAAIRACYNFRASDPRYQRLGFVLLGVATPTQLIGDQMRTPFNTGHGIELNDFTHEDARPLAAGLELERVSGYELLDRILYWTDGHPYLTQALCRHVSEYISSSRSEYGDSAQGIVDSIVSQWFLANKASREEHNIKFVRDRLTQAGSDTHRLLGLYREVVRGREVGDQRSSPIHALLKLSGAVKSDCKGQLQVRNRIYAKLFNSTWIHREMPLDRNRWIAVLFIAASLMGFLVWYTVFLPQSYARTLEVASEDYLVASDAYEKLRSIPFFGEAADELMAQFWDRRALTASGQQDRDRAILYWLRAVLRKDSEKRRKEVQHLIGSDYEALMFTFRDGHRICSANLGPNGRSVLTGNNDGTARLWRADTGQPVGEPMQHQGAVLAVAFGSYGGTVLTGSDDGTARLWRAESGQPIGKPMQHQGAVLAVALSPDGRTVLTGGSDGTARLWRADNGQPVGEPVQHQSPVLAVAFSLEGRTAFSASRLEVRRFRTESTDRSDRRAGSFSRPVSVVAISPDGRTVLADIDNRTVRLWKASIGFLRRSLQPVGQLLWQDEASAAAFSPDGNFVITGGHDGTAQLWWADTGQPLGPSMNHQGPVTALAFSLQGRTVLTGSYDGTARLWKVELAPHESRTTLIEGEPPALLEEWSRKLALQIDDQGEIVPLWPIEEPTPGREGRPQPKSSGQ